jgi:Enoyl-CoA hydratase/isomerase
MPNAATPVRVVEETPAYWRVVFDCPLFNMVDDTMFQSLQDLLARIDASLALRVLVFESAIPDFYLAHFDLTGKIGNIMTAVGRSGLPILMDTFVRLTKSAVVTIAKIRGCVRGVSSEFVLACDMRFASRENTRLGQPEVGVGSASRRRRSGTPPPFGRPRPRARNYPERKRLQRRYSGAIRIRQPRAARLRVGRLRRSACPPDRLLRRSPYRGGEASC